MVVTIDGPGGAGKTTISKELASRLGFAFLDTGALYRAVGLSAMCAGKDLTTMDEAMLQAWLSRVELELTPQGLHMDGALVEPFIRNEQVAAEASKVSTLPAVRRFLLDLQQKAGAEGNLVAEGRDMGTVVFAQAEVKFFLTASETERALRRWKDLQKDKPDISLESVRQEIAERDERDSTRSLAPLKAADDAVIIDSTDLTQEQVLAIMLTRVNQVMAGQ